MLRIRRERWRVAGRYDFHADQGATFDRTITWKDHTGSPIDVSGFSARMQIRDRIGGTVLHEFDSGDGSIVLGGSSGTIRLIASATDTEDWTWSEGIYDLELTDEGSVPVVVTRLLQGRFHVSPEVTT